MAANIRNNFRVYNAKTFIDSLKERSSTYYNTLYLAIGRPQEWPGANDNIAPLPGNNIKDELTDWADMMHMKRVFHTNICNAIPKRLWSPNTKWDIYRHDWNGYTTATDNTTESEVNPGEKPTDLSKVGCYCVTSNDNVYLCLKNAKNSNGSVAPSIVNPDSVVGNTTPIGGTTDLSSLKFCSDGYVWLLIAKSADIVSQFETLDYFPVRNADSGSVNSLATQYTLQTAGESYKGGIYNINVTSVGSGTLSDGTFHIKNASRGTVDPAGLTGDQILAVRGDGSGLEYSVTVVSGVVTQVYVTNPGSGYTWAKCENFATTGAAFEPILTPLYGISVDPVKTLNAFYVVVNMLIYDDENANDSTIVHGVDFTVDNDYRKIMLVSNPNLGGTLSEGSVIDMTYALGGAAIDADSIVVDGNSACFVVDGEQDVNRVIQTKESYNDSMENNNDLANGFDGRGNLVGIPGATLGSGDIIYADYRRPVARAAGQSEEFKIVLEF